MRQERRSGGASRVRYPEKLPLREGTQIPRAKEDISTLVKSGHFYFGLTGGEDRVDISTFFNYSSLTADPMGAFWFPGSRVYDCSEMKPVREKEPDTSQEAAHSKEKAQVLIR